MTAEEKVNPKSDDSNKITFWEILNQRVFHPFFGWFATSFIIWNWHSAAMFFRSKRSIEEVIVSIDGHIITSRIGFWAWPAFFALVIPAVGSIASSASEIPMIASDSFRRWVIERRLSTWRRRCSAEEDLARRDDEIQRQSRLQKECDNLRIERDNARWELDTARGNLRTVESANKTIQINYERDLENTYALYLELKKIVREASELVKISNGPSLLHALNPLIWDSQKHRTLEKAAINFNARQKAAPNS